MARPPLPRVLRIEEAATVVPRVPTLVPSALLTVPMPARLLTSQFCSVSVRTDIYGVEELGVIDHSAPFESALSAGTPYSVRPVHFRPLSETKNVEFFMHETCSVYFVLNRRARETVLDHFQDVCRVAP